MPFNAVPNKVDFLDQERQVLQFWQETRAFEKLVALHKGQPKWSFIDGPITANNPMGVHHGWGRTYKDLMLRFRTMQGHELRYQNGFDCQGLWVEVEVEKEMGFSTKKDIEDFGLELFVRQCKARVLRYAAVQTEQSQRLGYWMDWNSPELLRALADQLLQDPAQVITVAGPNGPVTSSVEDIVGRLGLPELGGSYFTFSDENNYMIWSFLKKCWQRGWLYSGADVMPWCPRCATAISQHEIVTDGYAMLTHRAVTLRFPLRSRPNESLLVWTTTPWTLTSNVAAAVGPTLTYVKVQQGEQVLYLSKGTLPMLRGSYQVLGELQGAEMEGWTYDGPFDDLPAAQSPGGHTHLKRLVQDVRQSAVEAHRVLLWDQVGEAEGTGIVHIAPGCGAEDFVLGKQYGLPLVAPLDDEGHFVSGFGWLSGMQVSQAATPIFADLERKGLLYHVEPYTHRYPTCWRCKTELVFRLVDEWFISMGVTYDKPRHALTEVEKAASLRYQIMDVVDQVRWIPEFGHAREMDWLRNMHDWMISKKRYWGLALPIWTCAACAHYEVLGGREELEQRAVAGWEVFDGHTPHRPYIDAVKLTCPQCGGQMNRVPEVGNPWLDAGIVPFSTLGYRTDRTYWEQWFPAHWISESFPGQFRNWFYSLLAMTTVLENRPAFLQNFGYATLLDEFGRPMHKSTGNSIEFNEAADAMGVDVMRWLFCTHKPENDLLFGYRRGDETRRRFLLPLWNVYSFFVTYANLDGWTPTQDGLGVTSADSPLPVGEGLGVTSADSPLPMGEGLGVRSSNILDRWILARLDEVLLRVTQSLENSDPLDATLVVESLLDDLTNWYVRRSRRRFWKSEADADKQSAYTTLYYVLVRLASLLAPFTPFVSEVIYQNLVRSQFPQAPESVHHTAWSQPDPSVEAPELLEQMELARSLSSLGLSARSAAGLKVRQPLARVLVHTGTALTLPTELVEVVTDELNVKAFEWVAQSSTLVSYRILPDNKVLGPRFGALFPQVRAALSQLDPAQVVQALNAGQPVRLQLQDQVVELTPGEVLVQTQPAAGLAVAADKRATLAVDTQVTPALRREGLARELVRRVQAMRKQAGFEIADRITLYYQAEGELAVVFQEWASYLQVETLSTALLAGSPPEQAYCEAHDLDGQSFTLGVLR